MRYAPCAKMQISPQVDIAVSNGTYSVARTVHILVILTCISTFSYILDHHFLAMTYLLIKVLIYSISNNTIKHSQAISMHEAWEQCSDTRYHLMLPGDDNVQRTLTSGMTMTGKILVKITIFSAMELTYNHKRELKAFLDRLSVHLVGEVGKSHIAGLLRVHKLKHTHNTHTVVSHTETLFPLVVQQG